MSRSELNPAVIAQKYIEKSKLDLVDLSPKNIAKADEFLRDVYSDWRDGKIKDLVAYEIGGFFEGEPIHHLMSVSVYPLCDIYFHLQDGSIDKIKNG